ncbi:MAG TPA: OmpA family protein [Paludibacter sp.]|nr:OmpA family protein [Paludibacter sp.]
MSKRIFYVIGALLLITVMVNAQINLGKVVKRSVKKAERSVENRVGNRIDKSVDKTLDTVEDSVFNTNQAKNKKSSEKKSTKSTNETAVENVEQSNNSTSTPQAKPTLTWAKYDFVPGTEIIFEDNQEGEQNGEFPGKWDLVQGNFENATFDGSNVIYHIKCNMNGGGGIVPMLKNAKEDYLPEEFTIEFDAYFTEDHGGSYHIYLGDYKNQRNLDKTYAIAKKYIRIYKNSVDGSGIEQNYYPGYKSGIFDKTPKWRHVAISFNKRALKVYLDDARVLNIPNLGYNPTGFSIGKQSVEGKNPGYTKNVRIAKGAVPLYDKFLTDGKFVTTGIKFDVNKATIKPESMGTINYVVKMMTDHPELKFSVEGHTDSDGDAAANQKLAEARAKAVVDAMVKAGISADQLTSKGWGESKPMTGNDTPEGKAQNRRVEFVKQ